MKTNFLSRYLTALLLGAVLALGFSHTSISVGGTDNFSSSLVTLTSPGLSAFAVTPADSTDLAVTTRAVYVGGGGDLEVILAGDTSSVVFKNVASGSLLSIRAKRIRNASTTATSILGVY